MAGLEVPLPCDPRGVEEVAGDGMERRKATNYEFLSFGDGVMAASQLLQPREPQLIETLSRP